MDLVHLQRFHLFFRCVSLISYTVCSAMWSMLGKYTLLRRSSSSQFLGDLPCAKSITRCWFNCGMTIWVPHKIISPQVDSSWNTLRVRSRAGRTRLPPVTDRSDRTARATPVCDRTPNERPTAPTQVTVGTNTSVDTEIDSRHTTSYSTSIDTMGLFCTVWPEINYFRFTLPVSDKLK